MTTYFVKTEDETLTVNLYPLSAYEADGGRYDDSGNGGEEVNPESFIAAIRVRDEDGYDIHPSDAPIGLTVYDVWRDSACGWYLITDWPETAPLYARMVESTA